MNAAFWRGKRILITGHTGFKGSWLSLWLQKLDAIVIGYSLAPPTQPSLFEAARVAEGMQSIIGDIRDLDHLQAVIRDQRPEIVIHMAAQPLVRYSYQNPTETYATNVMGTLNVLEAVRHAESVRAVVGVTSDKCYENREWVWGYREEEPMGGWDPYSSSKGCAELIISAYRHSYFSTNRGSGPNVAVASARAGNVIGGGDWAEDRLVPDIVRAILAQRPVIIRNPQAIRPWQHVLEPLHGYLRLAEKLWEQGAAFAQAWNFGANDVDAKPVSWIVECMTSLWGQGARWELDATRDHPHEATYLKLDCSKAKSLLGWSPKLCLAAALAFTVEWYREYQSHAEMRSLTEAQIAQYEALVAVN